MAIKLRALNKIRRLKLSKQAAVIFLVALAVIVLVGAGTFALAQNDKQTNHNANNKSTQDDRTDTNEASTVKDQSSSSSNTAKKDKTSNNVSASTQPKNNGNSSTSTPIPATFPGPCTAIVGSFTADSMGNVKGVASITMRAGCTSPQLMVTTTDGNDIGLEPNSGSFTFSNGSTYGSDNLPYTILLPYSPVITSGSANYGFGGKTVSYKVKTKSNAQPGTYTASFSTYGKYSNVTGLFTVTITVIN